MAFFSVSWRWPNKTFFYCIGALIISGFNWAHTLLRQFYRACSLRWLVKITFTVHLLGFCSAIEWKPATSAKHADCQNLSLKTNNSQQNVESRLFLHRGHYIGQSLVLDASFPFPQWPPKSLILAWSRHVTSVTRGDLWSANLKISIICS